MTGLRETLLPGDGADKKKPIELDINVDYSSVTLPDHVNAAAIRAVAERATDAADARLLLDALDLTRHTRLATPAAHITDCEPAMPRIPVAIEVDMTTTRLNGRHIRDIPTRGLL